MLGRSKRTHRIRHGQRPVTPGRPVHVTVHLADGLPSLRTGAVLDLFRPLVHGIRARGVRPVAYTLMGNHMHLICVPSSKEALRDAMRYLLSLFAQGLNRLWGRARGKVFEDRYWSQCGKTARHAWQMLGYVLRNPVAAGVRTLGIRDPWVRFDLAALAADRFLGSVLGPTETLRRETLAAMMRGPVPFRPLHGRMQLALPGV